MQKRMQTEGKKMREGGGRIERRKAERDRNCVKIVLCVHSFLSPFHIARAHVSRSFFFFPFPQLPCLFPVRSFTRGVSSVLCQI